VNPNEYDFVLSQLEYLPNLKSWISRFNGGVIKTRYIERVTLSRIFQTYTVDRNYSNLDFQNHLKSFFDSREVGNIIVMDYGHGLFDIGIIDFLLNLNLPISVNAQSNAQNRGFNSIAKYKGADRVFLNGTEVLLEIRDKNPDLGIAVPELCSRLEFKEAYITNGARGIIGWTDSQSMHLAPAFAPRILDRLGAGDATLAMISALRMADTPMDISLFFGNIAGAMLVGSIGNEISLRTELVLSQAEKILKKVTQGD
jgi:bifunctional ADP-heptose synthase (sugar kinase/adenylyltransferase)